jgi:hypothetical protein
MGVYLSGTIDLVLLSIDLAAPSYGNFGVARWRTTWRSDRRRRGRWRMRITGSTTLQIGATRAVPNNDIILVSVKFLAASHVVQVGTLIHKILGIGCDVWRCRIDLVIILPRYQPARRNSTQIEIG